MSKVFKNKSGLGIIDVSIYSIVAILVCYLILFVFCYTEHITIQRGLDTIAETNLDAISENREINNAMYTTFKEEANSYKFYIATSNSQPEFHFDYYQYKYNKADGSFNKQKLDLGTITGTGIKFQKGDVVRVEITYGFKDDEDTPLTRLSRVIGTGGPDSYKASLIGYAEGGVD